MGTGFARENDFSIGLVSVFFSPSSAVFISWGESVFSEPKDRDGNCEK